VGEQYKNQSSRNGIVLILGFYCFRLSQSVIQSETQICFEQVTLRLSYSKALLVSSVLKCQRPGQFLPQCVSSTDSLLLFRTVAGRFHFSCTRVNNATVTYAKGQTARHLNQFWYKEFYFIADFCITSVTFVGFIISFSHFLDGLVSTSLLSCNQTG
jgi:hypothetical protein